MRPGESLTTPRRKAFCREQATRLLCSIAAGKSAGCATISTSVIHERAPLSRDASTESAKEQLMKKKTEKTRIKSARAFFFHGQTNITSEGISMPLIRLGPINFGCGFSIIRTARSRTDGLPNKIPKSAEKEKQRLGIRHRQDPVRMTQSSTQQKP